MHPSPLNLEKIALEWIFSILPNVNKSCFDPKSLLHDSNGNVLMRSFCGGVLGVVRCIGHSVLLPHDGPPSNQPFLYVCIFLYFFCIFVSLCNSPSNKLAFNTMHDASNYSCNPIINRNSVPDNDERMHDLWYFIAWSTVQVPSCVDTIEVILSDKSDTGAELR